MPSLIEPMGHPMFPGNVKSSPHDQRHVYLVTKYLKQFRTIIVIY